MKELRKSGIDVIGNVPFGTHLCLFYDTKKDLLDILAPYFKTGLEHNELCMWITSGPLGVEDAETALRNAVPELDEYKGRGQIEIMDYAQWYMPSGTFEPGQVLRNWAEKEVYALQRGFSGLRATGNASWSGNGDRANFMEYEKMADAAIGDHRMIALCTYQFNKCGASEIMDVVSNHRFSLARRGGKWAAIESVQRKRMEEELRESEQRFRTIFDNNNEGMIVAAVESKKFLFSNPMICRMLGYTEEELVNLGVADIHPHEDLPYVLEQFERQTRGEMAVAEGLPVKRKDGSVFYADVSSFPITLGKKECLIGAFRDITDRKLAEEAIRKRNEELVALNREIARQREQLRAFALMLAETEENERKRLSQELHDEVGQNLTVLGINLNIALSQAPEETATMIRPRIVDSLALVDQIAERVRNVMANLRPPVLDDYGLAPALAWYAEKLSLRTGISVEVSTEETVPRLSSQAENFLFRIVQEALANVVKHARATRATVAVESGDSGTIRLVVEDNGVGFDTSRRTAPDKWGLITMAERARAIGGACRMESRPGHGTRVIVEMRA